MPKNQSLLEEITFDTSVPDFISEYEERFGHPVPLTRDPKREEKLMAALETGVPVQEWAEWPHKMQGDYFVDEDS